ncbi:galanin receptor 2a-like [Lytechinus variegatus]|uniref:galanin receptor 2a-like n=1 Tax=Lytechinus variegatus TaxID=7654 RepID=UPI001BB1D0F3|nr:galanin receptor 2a-like [Lytechinus variegatus]
MDTTTTVTIGAVSSKNPTITQFLALHASTHEPETVSDVTAGNNDTWYVTTDVRNATIGTQPLILNVTNGYENVKYNTTSDTTSMATGELSSPSGTGHLLYTTRWTVTDNATFTTMSISEEWVWSAISFEWWEIIQIILAIVGIIGNFLVMLVLFRRKRQSYSTDTLIAALAAADFTTSVFVIPHPHAVMLPDSALGQVYCRIIHSSVIMWISICASIFTLTTISVERLLAIRYPFVFQRVFTSRRIVIAIVIIWLVAVAINSFSFYIHYVQDGTCVTVFPTTAIQKAIGVTLFLVEYVVPVIIMLTAHALTIYSLRQNASPVTLGQERIKHAQKLTKARQRVLQMLFIVVVTFIVCWTPDQFGFLVFNLGVVGIKHLFSPLYRCFVALAFANSCLNPIIYASRNPRFRKALTDIFRGVCTSSGQSLFAGFDDHDDSKEINTGASELPTNDQSQSQV